MFLEDQSYKHLQRDEILQHVVNANHRIHQMSQPERKNIPTNFR